MAAKTQAEKDQEAAVAAQEAAAKAAEDQAKAEQEAAARLEEEQAAAAEEARRLAILSEPTSTSDKVGTNPWVTAGADGRPVRK